MVTYSSIELAIVDRLKEHLEPYKISVCAAPETQKDFEPPVGPRVTVAYVKSTFDIDQFSVVGQMESLTFLVQIEGKALRNERTGVYAILLACKKLLIGYSVSGLNNIYIRSIDTIEDGVGGAISYMMTIGIDMQNVGNPIEDVGPLLKTLAFDEPTFYIATTNIQPH